MRTAKRRSVWPRDLLAHGIMVKLKKVLFKVSLYKVVAINGDT